MLANEWAKRREAQARLANVQAVIRRWGYTTGADVMERGQAKDDVWNATQRIRRRIADIRAEGSWIEAGGKPTPPVEDEGGVNATNR